MKKNNNLIPTYEEFENYCKFRNFWIIYRPENMRKLYDGLEERNWKTKGGIEPSSWQHLVACNVDKICGKSPYDLFFEIPSKNEFDSFCINEIGGHFSEVPKLIDELWYSCQSLRWAYTYREEYTKAQNWKEFAKETCDWNSRRFDNIYKNWLMKKTNIEKMRYVQNINRQDLTEFEIANTDKHYICYTDGSCDNIQKPHVGGASYIVLHNGEEVYMKNCGFVNTTNNRMEMLSIISAAKYCPEGSIVDIYSDSQYAINVLSGKWGHKKNADLFERYVECSKHLKAVRFFWVKGHNGDTYNELADKLAYEAYCDKCKEIGVPVSTSPYVVGGYSKQ